MGILDNTLHENVTTTTYLQKEKKSSCSKISDDFDTLLKTQTNSNQSHTANITTTKNTTFHCFIVHTNVCQSSHLLTIHVKIAESSYLYDWFKIEMNVKIQKSWKQADVLGYIYFSF